MPRLLLRLGKQSREESECDSSVVPELACSSHKVLIDRLSRSFPGLPQTSHVREDSCSAASMRLRMAAILTVYVHAQAVNLLLHLRNFKLDCCVRSSN